MDYIKDFDIRLEKEMFYAGEVLQGNVLLNTTENFKLRAIRVVLRGKAHAEWKVMVSGDRRTVKDDQYFVDDRAVIWGKDNPEGNVPVLPKGLHSFPFRFQLPESSLPCSFESKAGTIRYYIKVTVDMPYASPPQGMKYFTVIGPHIDCMDEQYLKPMCGEAKRSLCCLCCARGPVTLRSQLERSAYVCGESIKLRAEIDNQSDQDVTLKIRLVQYVEYYLDRGVLGVTKDLQHSVLEYTGDCVGTGTRWKFDSSQCLVVPVMPPTLLSVCRLIQIYYVLKVNVELSKAGEDLHMHFPITIATVPFRIPNSKLQPNITYSVCCDHVEGGMYIGPEFQLGQVYDGGGDGSSEPVLLYRPVYVCIPNPKLSTTPSSKTKKMVFDSSSRTTSRSGTSASLLSKLDSSSGLGHTGRTRSNTTSTEADRVIVDNNGSNNEECSAAGSSGLPRTDSAKSVSQCAGKSRENVLEKSVESSDPTEKKLARALSKAALRDSTDINDVKLTRGSSKSALKGSIDADGLKLLRGLSRTAIRDTVDQIKPKLVKGLSKSAIRDDVEPKLMRGLSKIVVKGNVEPIEPKLVRGLSKNAVKNGAEPTDAQLTRGLSKTTQDSHNRNSL